MTGESEIFQCSQCECDIRKNTASISCSLCYSWFHKGCSGLSTKDFNKHSSDWKKTGKHSWVCDDCEIKKLSSQTSSERKSQSSQRRSGVFVNAPSTNESAAAKNKHRSGTDDRGHSGKGVATPSISGTVMAPDISKLLSKSVFTIKYTVLIIGQLYAVIMEQNKKMESVLEEIKSAKADQQRLVVLEELVHGLRSDLVDLRGGVNVPAIKNDQDSETLLEEMQDRSLRAKNIIFHNVEESLSKDFQQRIAHDCDIAESTFASIGVIPGIFKASRVGKPRKNIKRPLRVTFNNTQVVRDCLAKRKKLIETQTPIRLSADMTIAQRKHLKKLYEEVGKRKEEGEIDLFVKFFNGIPRIVSNKPNPKNGEQQEGSSTP